VRTADGKLLYQRKGASQGRIIEPQYVAMMNAMLQETLSTGTGKRASISGWQAAGKTGTSQDYRDAWFVGYTSHMVAGVWLGNDDNSPTKKASGANIPVDVWNRFMREAHKTIPPQPLPGGLWRDAAQPTPPPSIRPPADVPLPVAHNTQGGPLQLPGAPKASPAAPSPVAAQRPATPRRDPIADMLAPPATIPNGKPAAQKPAQAPQEKNFFERLFGG
jgi:penicillin-binding protein 1A